MVTPARGGRDGSRGEEAGSPPSVGLLLLFLLVLLLGLRLFGLLRRRRFLGVAASSGLGSRTLRLLRSGLRLRGLRLRLSRRNGGPPAPGSLRLRRRLCGRRCGLWRRRLFQRPPSAICLAPELLRRGTVLGRRAAGRRSGSDLSAAWLRPGRGRNRSRRDGRLAFDRPAPVILRSLFDRRGGHGLACLGLRLRLRLALSLCRRLLAIAPAFSSGVAARVSARRRRIAGRGRRCRRGTRGGREHGPLDGRGRPSAPGGDRLHRGRCGCRSVPALAACSLRERDRAVRCGGANGGRRFRTSPLLDDPTGGGGVHGSAAVLPDHVDFRREGRRPGEAARPARPRAARGRSRADAAPPEGWCGRRRAARLAWERRAAARAERGRKSPVARRPDRGPILGTRGRPRRTWSG